MKFFSAFFPLFMVGALATACAAQQHVRPGSLPPAATPQTLTLHQAEQIAISNHPEVQSALHLAFAARAQVTEARSAYYPNVFGSATGVDAENNSRIAAGAINNPVIYERYANGLTVQQLITDFGRTHELVKSSNFHAKAQQENVASTKEDVLLAVDQAYFNVLKSQAVLTVANQTVKTRQLVYDQVSALEQNKIRSGLDVSFADVNLDQAKLLLVQSQNDLEAAYAQLSAALGTDVQHPYQLTEESLPGAPPVDFNTMVQVALQNRPDLVSLRYEVSSAQSYATAERDLSLPTLSAVGMAGLTPFAADELAPRYAAVGFNLNIPIFNGRLFSSLHTEAEQRAQAESENLRGLQNNAIRDLRSAWLNANSAYQRLALTNELLDQANMSLDLANSRYKLGLSSIIELTQAQLNQTQAEIEQTSAKYDYQATISTLNYEMGQLQ